MPRLRSIPTVLNCKPSILLGFTPTRMGSEAGRQYLCHFLVWAFVFVFLASVLNTVVAHADSAVASESNAKLASNNLCPVTPERAVDPDVSTEFQGHRIAFCCERCRKAFIRSPEEYTTNLPIALAKLQDADHHDEGEHDHSAHATSEHGSFSVMTLVGKFHPLLIHFPIALVIAAGIAEVFGVLRRSEHAGYAARFMITLASAFAVPVVISGLLLANASYGVESQNAVLVAHRWAGLTSGILIICTTLAAWHAQRRSDSKVSHRFYRILLAISVLTVSSTGHLGATLVYGRAYWGFPLPFIE